MITKKYYKMVRVSYADSDLFQINNLTNEVGAITVTNQYIGGTLQYSTDGANFTTAVFTNNTCEIELPAGGNCYFKGTDFRRTSTSDNTIFNCSVNHNVRGNLYSLVDPTNYASATASYDYMFYSLFNNNTHLVDAGGLMLPVGVTSLGDSALTNAFNGCTSLTTAPDLSYVTSLGSYALGNAFQGCTSLSTAPDLSYVTSLGTSALTYAFKGCTSLSTAPDLSSVTSLGNGALNTAFKGCTSLSTAPDLSSVTSLGNGALSYAFRDCTHLQTIYVPNIDIWDTGKFSSWVQSAGTQAATPRQMIFQTQALLDACPSGYSGYGYGEYTKVLA